MELFLRWTILVVFGMLSFSKLYASEVHNYEIEFETVLFEDADSIELYQEKIKKHLNKNRQIFILMDEDLGNGYTGSQQLQSIKNQFGEDIKVISFSTNDIINEEYDFVVKKEKPFLAVKSILDYISKCNNNENLPVSIIYVDDRRMNLKIYNRQFKPQNT